ncbi:cysteine-rich receptor-like protein kinase 44 isoform X2 [Miscanthus floridulus]|uniref:cysteine-rich receptor-like protein kinase 44 isoform X2 n=1 Tax=Miscanthus floridulus TaxID=154761 RepID=UPI0034595122
MGSSSPSSKINHSCLCYRFQQGVYKGKEIAVKKLHQLQGLDDKAFDNEFRNLSKVHHKNVVKLVGYCYESRRKYVQHNGELILATLMERILCFEYMECGSLDKHITDESCDLDWPTCYQIIKGTCEGINHLHSAYEKPIFHLDLKPDNILLDNNKMAKIADLGLSKLVASTQTHKTETVKGTHGYMPPEYVDNGSVSKKYDVFSLGVIIIKVMDGNMGRTRSAEMDAKQFTEHVCEKWKKRLQEMPDEHPSLEIEILRVKKCIDIALRCVIADRKTRPSIKDVVDELEQLEAEIMKMSLPSDETKDLIVQRSSDFNLLAIDPALELCFLFEPRKAISCCLQLTNITDGFIAFNIKINRTKYRAQPSKGMMRPCSKRYITVTLLAQEEALVQCHDMFIVLGANVNKDLKSDEITEDLFKEAMKGKVVDVVKLPIVYVVMDQFSCYSCYETIRE